MSNPIKLTQIKKDGTTSSILVGIRNATRVEDGVTRIWATNSNTHYVKESLEEIEDLMLRDRFAMSAMNGVVAGLFAKEDGYSLGLTSIANWAFQQADAMLKARKEGV